MTSTRTAYTVTHNGETYTRTSNLYAMAVVLFADDQPVKWACEMNVAMMTVMAKAVAAGQRIELVATNEVNAFTPEILSAYVATWAPKQGK